MVPPRTGIAGPLRELRGLSRGPGDLRSGPRRVRRDPVQREVSPEPSRSRGALSSLRAAGSPAKPPPIPSHLSVPRAARESRTDRSWSSSGPRGSIRLRGTLAASRRGGGGGVDGEGGRTGGSPVAPWAGECAAGVNRGQRRRSPSPSRCHRTRPPPWSPAIHNGVPITRARMGWISMHSREMERFMGGPSDGEGWE